MYVVENGEKGIGMVVYEKIKRVGFVGLDVEKGREYREGRIRGG